MAAPAARMEVRAAPAVVGPVSSLPQQAQSRRLAKIAAAFPSESAQARETATPQQGAEDECVEPKLGLACLNLNNLADFDYALRNETGTVRVVLKQAARPKRPVVAEWRQALLNEFF